tara:strand:- start:19 stop:891 length:873 start_codon:yes stop_codon:yes gene_type:complete
MKDEDLTRCSKDLFEIIKGYSCLSINKVEYYFKHLYLLELLEIESLEQEDIQTAVKSGIKRQDDLVSDAIKRGFWSINKEEEIKSLDWTLKRSYAALSKIQDEKQKSIFQSQIETQENQLKIVKTERSKITSYSAEHSAEIKKVKRIMRKCLFLDSDFKENYKDVGDISATSTVFKRFQELNSRDNVLKASWYGGFFDLFAAQNGNSVEMLGRTFTTITNYQKNLIVLSNALLNKMKNVKIPDNISGDPVKIMDYVEKEETEAKVSHGVEDLRRKAQVRDGKLKAEDFLS